jgi:hypothetical protein
MGNAQRVLDSLWAILNPIGKPLESALIKLVSTSQMFLWAGGDEKSRK